MTNTYSLDHDYLLAAHRGHTHVFKWATERKIKEDYQIPSNVLDDFHKLYGLPRLLANERQPLLYSLPALEIILETVTELHDRGNLS